MLSSSRPTGIILHGDHGSGLHFNLDHLDEKCLWERYSPLLAVYSSDGRFQEAVAAGTSLVNVYRIFFNTYFNSGLPVLQNRYFYAPFSELTKIQEVSVEYRDACARP